MSESSRSTYVLLGGVGGLSYGIAAMLKPGLSDIAVYVLPASVAAGAFLGATLHATKKWDERGPAGDLLRWISGLGGAGLALAALGLLFGIMPLGVALMCVGGGLIAGLFFGLESQQRTVFGDDVYRDRTPREVVQLWSVLLVTFSSGIGLVALGIHLGG